MAETNNNARQAAAFAPGLSEGKGAGRKAGRERGDRFLKGKTLEGLVVAELEVGLVLIGLVPQAPLLL